MSYKIILIVFIISTNLCGQNLPGLEFLPIEADTFLMGMQDGEFDEKPVHAVALSGFEISKFEITVGQYRTFARKTGRAMPDPPEFGWNDDYPIVNVSWHDANAFASWLSDVTGGHHRLPTEAEWEYVARGGGKDYLYVNDDEASGNVADESAKEQRGGRIWNGYTDGYVYTSPVGSFDANELGLYDMDGNVAEWCLNWHYTYSDQMITNPQGPAVGKNRVFRGAAFISNPWYSRTAQRSFMPPDFKNNYLGFRIVKEVSKDSKTPEP